MDQTKRRRKGFLVKSVEKQRWAGEFVGTKHIKWPGGAIREKGYFRPTDRGLTVKTEKVDSALRSQ